MQCCRGRTTKGIATKGIATKGIATRGIATKGIATKGFLWLIVPLFIPISFPFFKCAL